MNGKVYIGVHEGTLDDDYLGSGTLISRAIKKHGRDSFKREIVAEFETIQEAFDLESELVDESFVKRSDTYNLRTGGKGGFSHLGRDRRPGYKHSEESLAKISATSKGRTKSEESKRKVSEKLKGRFTSDETKAKMRQARLGKTNLGAVGRVYVTNGEINKRVPKDTPLQEGWSYGRTPNWSIS
jgi:hypothetical protein